MNAKLSYLTALLTITVLAAHTVHAAPSSVMDQEIQYRWCNGYLHFDCSQDYAWSTCPLQSSSVGALSLDTVERLLPRVEACMHGDALAPYQRMENVNSLRNSGLALFIGSTLVSTFSVAWMGQHALKGSTCKRLGAAGLTLVLLPWPLVSWLGTVILASDEPWSPEQIGQEVDKEIDNFEVLETLHGALSTRYQQLTQQN